MQFYFPTDLQKNNGKPFFCTEDRFLGLKIRMVKRFSISNADILFYGL